jgi:4-amino-4-deoxy-L-arabinose transferase-like glycosyltransferase
MQLRFWRVLLLVVLAALAFRVGYVLLAKHDEPRLGDQIYYNVAADQLARGEWFTDPRDGSETAQHPPLTALALAPTSWVAERVDEGGDHVLAQRLTMAVFGAGVVVLTALVGRTVGGDRAGIVAAIVAALYPNLWMNDGLVMSETLATGAVALAILLAYRFGRDPTWQNAGWLGAACGIAVLARSELGLLLPFMVLPVALFARSLPTARRLAWFGVSCLAALVVVSPWLVANLTRFDEAVFFSTNDGLTICGANNDRTYDGDGIGLWANQDCGAYLEPLTDLGLEASTLSNDLRHQGIDYLTDHFDRVPVVVAARVARVWSLYAPGYMADYNEGEGREQWASWLGFATFWILLPFAVAGVVLLRRRRVPITPLVAQFVLVTVTAALVYGLVRFRTPAEVSIVVLAAVAIDAVLARVRPGQSAAGAVECAPETVGNGRAPSPTGASFS